MKNHIALTVKKRDFETSNYQHTTDCALARALKRMGYKLGFEGSLGAVGGDYVWFGPDRTRDVRYDRNAGISQRYCLAGFDYRRNPKR